MNKVITVNLNGNAYQVEESGYAALEEYLADAEAKLKGNPDLTEIMADLEQAVADKCNQRLTPNKNVVTQSEIEQILKEMGPVESDSEEGPAEPPKESARPASSAPKRLYRIREGSMIGGVCNGLAAYLNVDVTLVRLAFAFLAIASAGFMVLAYFVAMIVIPEAETFEQRAEAHGLPFNAQELVDEAKKHYSNFKKDAEQWWRRSGPGSPNWKLFNRNARREAHRAARQARRAFRSARWPVYPSPEVDPAMHVLSLVLLPVFGLVVAALTVLWILAIISLVNTGAVFGWPVPVAIPIWAAILILIALYSAIVGPFKMAFHGRGYYSGLPGVLGGMVWLACMVLAFAFSYTYIPEVREFVQNLPSTLNDLVRR